MYWFYEENGKIIGPISRSDIIRLIIQRHIKSHTLVWTEEFGEEWRPVSHSGLIAPLPPHGLKEKKMPFLQIHIARIGAYASLKEKSTKTPEEVSSFWAWVFLLVPDGLLMFMQIMAYLRGQTWSLAMSSIAFFSLVIILVTSVISDRKELRSAGVKAPWLLLCLVPSVYFWLRATALGRGRILFLCSILMIALRFLVSTYDPPSSSLYAAYRWKSDVTHSVSHDGSKNNQITPQKQSEDKEVSF